MIVLLVLGLFPLLAQAQLHWELLDEGKSSPLSLPRQDTALGYDDIHERLVVFGGRTEIRGREVVLGDMWTYDLKSGRL